MKTEHEKLKVICDTTKYMIDTSEYYWYDDSCRSLRSSVTGYEVNVREVICTHEFMGKLFLYIKNTDLEIKKGDYMNGYTNYIKSNIIDNLDFPVEYIYNILELGIPKN